MRRGCPKRSLDACVDCVTCEYGPQTAWNGCFNCRHRDPLNGLGGEKLCSTCHHVNLMRVEAGQFTPSRWMWDEGDERIDRVAQLIFQIHSSPGYKKAQYLLPLKEALEEMQTMYPKLFTEGEDDGTT